MFYVYSLLLIFSSFFFGFFICNSFSSNLSYLSLKKFWAFLSYYFENGFLFKTIIFQLAGLPPVFIFLLKFNFIVSVFYKSNIFLLILVILNFILGTVFYLQWFKLYSFFSDRLFLKKIFSSNYYKIFFKKEYYKKKFEFFFFLVFFIFITFFSSFFLLDLTTFFSLCF